MAHDFIPSREADLLDWSRNFRERINANPAQYGLTAAQASEYAALDDAYAEAYRLAHEPNTRTSVQITAKNEAKKAVTANARMLARIVRATPGISNTQRGELGLTVPDAELTPVPRPSDPPLLWLVPSADRVVRVRLRDKAAPTRRGKPPGVAGAAMLSCVADEPPARLADWTFHGNATRPTYAIQFDAQTPAGAKVWIAAYWYNTRGQSGPLSTPISVRMQDGIATHRKAA